MSTATFNRQASPAEMASEIDRRGTVIEALEAEIAAMRESAGYPAFAIEELRYHQTQLDMDGVMVGVSRQALEEVLTYYGGPSGVTAGWSYQINHGPDGQEEWANLTTPNGEHVANIRTHHAIAIVRGLNASLTPSKREGIEEAARVVKGAAAGASANWGEAGERFIGELLAALRGAK